MTTAPENSPFSCLECGEPITVDWLGSANEDGWCPTCWSELHYDDHEDEKQ